MTTTLHSDWTPERELLSVHEKSPVLYRITYQNDMDNDRPYSIEVIGYPGEGHASRTSESARFWCLSHFIDTWIERARS